MRLRLILPVVKAGELVPPTTCPHEGCSGTYFRLYQRVEKPLKDTVHRQVTVHRHRCLACGRTFRVYPSGVTNAQTSDRVKGLAVLLYGLGLSYGAVSRTLVAFARRRSGAS